MLYLRNIYPFFSCLRRVVTDDGGGDGGRYANETTDRAKGEGAMRASLLC